MASKHTRTCVREPDGFNRLSHLVSLFCMLNRSNLLYRIRKSNTSENYYYAEQWKVHSCQNLSSMCQKLARRQWWLHCSWHSIYGTEFASYIFKRFPTNHLELLVYPFVWMAKYLWVIRHKSLVIGRIFFWGDACFYICFPWHPVQCVFHCLPNHSMRLLRKFVL